MVAGVTPEDEDSEMQKQIQRQLVTSDLRIQLPPRQPGPKAKSPPGEQSRGTLLHMAEEARRTSKPKARRQQFAWASASRRAIGSTHVEHDPGGLSHLKTWISPLPSSTTGAAKI